MGIIVRCPVLYVASKKVAEMQDVKYHLTSNDEAQIGPDGYLGHSDGALLSGFSANTILPFTGYSVDMITPMFQKKYVKVGVPIGGKFHSMEMRIVKAEFSGDVKSGKATGQFEFEGGKPTVG